MEYILLAIIILFIPLIMILIYLCYASAWKLRGVYLEEKYEYIDHANFEHIYLLPIVKTDYKTITGEYGLVVFDVTKVYKAQEQKMYTGGTAGGISVPFTTLSYTRRKFYKKNNYMTYGESRVTLTNIKLRVQCFDSPYLVEFNMFDINKVKLVDNGKTVFVSAEELDPIKIQFKNTEEAIYFINCIWSIKYYGYQHYQSRGRFPMIKEGVEYKEKIITKWDIRRQNKQRESFEKQYPFLDYEEYLSKKYLGTNSELKKKHGYVSNNNVEDFNNYKYYIDKGIVIKSKLKVNDISEDMYVIRKDNYESK